MGITSFVLGRVMFDKEKNKGWRRAGPMTEYPAISALRQDLSELKVQELLRELRTASNEN